MIFKKMWVSDFDSIQVESYFHKISQNFTYINELKYGFPKCSHFEFLSGWKLGKYLSTIFRNLNLDNLKKIKIQK